MAKRDYQSKAAQNVNNFKKEKTSTTLEPHVEETIRTYLDETHEEMEQTPTVEKYGGNNQSDDGYENPYARKTYYLEHVQIEAIDILAFKTKKDKSELVREMIDKSISPEVRQEAEERVAAFRTRNR